MINFSIGIRNPFEDTSKREWYQKDYIEYDKPIKWWKNKNLSFQISETPGIAFEFDFRFSWRAEDHAGLNIHIDFWKWFAVLNVYDSRHWNYEKNRFYDYDE